MITLTSANLPSRMVPYRVKEFDMKWFTPKQIPMLSKAVHLDDMAPVVDALGSVLTGLDVMDLTTYDFFYLLTLQRLHCFKRRPLYAEWTCGGAIFQAIGGPETYTPAEVDALVQQWRKATLEERKLLEDPEDIILEGDLCNHTNYEELKEEDFQIIRLREDFVLPEGMDFPRVVTLAEYCRIRTDVEFGDVADVAQWVKSDESLNDRIQKMVEGDMTFFEDLCNTASLGAHGIAREVMKACSKCSHRHAIHYVVSAQSFLK